MADEVYIEFEESQTLLNPDDSVIDTGKFRVDLAPIGMVEDTYVKSADVMPLPSYAEDAENPKIVITDMKQTLHKFVLTGTLTELDGVDKDTKKRYLKYLYGYLGRSTNTRLAFFYEDTLYYVFMTRLTTTQASGEDFFEYIIELTEGIDYDTGDW
jgi:hypothetical protein